MANSARRARPERRRGQDGCTGKAGGHGRPCLRVLRLSGCKALATTAAADTRAFKEQVADAVPVLEAAEDALEVQISYRLSSHRNWSTLWKPTIDALGGVLGIPDPARPFMPRDDRIVRLGLHRAIDASLGWDIAIAICWRTATSSSGSPARRQA
jgi:hypothetical protein